MTEKYILYIDDTGSRDPNQVPYDENRDDGMDCFGLGGILIKEGDVEDILTKHKEFCTEWDITYPLHSSSIRGGRRNFGWLRNPENAGQFFPALNEYLLSLPIICTACIIDRPGYRKRYDHYNDRLWFMCKTAFCILVERTAKYVDSQDGKFEIYFEQTGKKEDTDIKNYVRELKREGNPFDSQNSDEYEPFTAEDYKRVVLGEPREKTKKVPMIQIADLVLYPMAKGKYQPQYGPYKALKNAGKLIDSFVPEDQINKLGIKYSCFDE
ncbi:MAG: DUF3800 domain-containing protein [Methyloligellaceae bacterium]